MSPQGSTEDAIRPSWQATELWRRLSDREDVESRDILADINNPLHLAEAVLKSGGTTPGRFTLHDEMHSYRVAQRMVEIVEVAILENMSSYELALLLMSAYMHDIGMSPEQGHLQKHEEYLRSQKPDLLSVEEITSFESFLDARALRGAEPSEMLAYYVRERHNDWSESWIRKNLTGGLGAFPNWVPTLVMLCRSHHEGYEELASNRFDASFVGGKSEIVRLRYLAAMLRVADILDFDPERTPTVIYRHRAIPEASKIYWHKDHVVSIKIKHNDFSIFFARPSQAIIQRAVLDMADAIDYELQLCQRLSERPGFGYGKAEDAPKWSLVNPLRRDIGPQPGTYEYIHGEFRANTPRLLRLLAGSDLYGRPEAAVRELLQNAFDAITLAIARERLASRDPRDVVIADDLAKKHEVRITLEIIGENRYLYCSDSGVGMDKSAIEGDFLVAGSEYRSEIRVIEQQCRRAGFRLERIGQFGIGVLSYFMLADEVVVTTRTAQAGSEAWQFTTSGFGNFGELHRLNSAPVGTNVRLRLRPGVLGDSLLDAYHAVLKYLDKTLVRIPCCVIVSTSPETAANRTFERGWVRTTGALAELIASELGRSGFDSRDDDEKAYENMKAEIGAALSWRSKEIELGDLGRARLSIPVFKLLGGSSLGFFRISAGDQLIAERVGNGYVFFTDTLLQWSWNGFGIKNPDEEGKPEHEGPAVIEVDWHSGRAVTITASRNSITVEQIGEEAIAEALRASRIFRAEVLEQIGDSPYRLINATIHGGFERVSGNLYWPQRRLGTLEIVPLQPPVLVGPDSYNAEQTAVSNLSECPVILGFERTAASLVATQTLSPPAALLSPSRVLAANFENRYVMFALCDPVALAQYTDTPGARCDFAPSWAELCGVHLNLGYSFRNSVIEWSRSYVWNRNNSVVRWVDEASWNWACEIFSLPITERVSELISARKSKSHTSAWLIRCLLEDEGATTWTHLISDYKLINEIWEKVCPSYEYLMLWLGEYRSLGYMRVISRRAIFEGKELDIKGFLPPPGKEWNVAMKIAPPREGELDYIMQKANEYAKRLYIERLLLNPDNPQIGEGDEAADLGSSLSGKEPKI